MSSRIRRGRCVRRRWERWSVLYVVHRLLQGLGPDDATPAGISADKLAHRSALLASEVVVGLALLAVIVFIAAFASLIRQAGRDSEPEESYLHVVSSRGVSGPRAGDAHRWPIVHIPATIPLTYDTRGVALAGGVAVA